MEQLIAICRSWKPRPPRHGQRVNTESELPVIETESKPPRIRIEDYSPGYPQYCALIAAHDFFFAFRSFRKIRARLLLLKQDKLSMLESRLDQVDREEPSPLFLGKSRCDRNEARISILSQIETSLAEYDMFAERTRQVLSYDHANPRDVHSLHNWVNGTGCLSRDETAYLEEGRDMISLAYSNDCAVEQLKHWVEGQLIRYYQGFRALPGYDVSTNPNVYIYFGTLFKGIAKGLMLFLITFLLLMPVIICIMLNSLSARIFVIVISTASYLTALSQLTKSRMMELGLAGATNNVNRGINTIQVLEVYSYFEVLIIPLNKRYSRLDAMVDLDEATRIGQEIIDIITNPQDHSDQILHILVRASALGHEYLRTAVAKDLEGPIRIRQEATNATDQDSFGQALHLYHDTDEFDKMYRTIEAAVDLEDSQAYLEEGIQIAREMSDLIPQDHPARAMFLYSLGVQLRIKYSITGAVADLDRVIQIRRELVNTTPLHRLERVEYLHDLGVQFEDRYLVLQMETDLEQAIQIIRQAVDEAPTDYLNRARFLNSLGKLIGEKHSRTHAIADLEDSISCHRSALHQLNSPIMTRIVAGREILENCALIPDWQQAYEAADIAVHLIPKLLSQSLENSDRQKVLGQLNCLASDAAAVALSARKGPLAALEFLEQGRSVLAAHLEGMHTGTLNLRKDHPGLAEEFICLQNDLEIPKDRESSCKDDASWRSKKHDELDSLNDEIREQAGYENFWLAQNITRMRVAASYGPIVLINVSDYRCDAILIEQHQIRSIYLPNLSSTDVTEKSDRDDPGSPNILEWLWNTITNPILDALGFTQPPCHENWPRVWWITTGLLSKFPLHASGRHSKDSTETVLDRVISSYSSSVRAIIQSRSHRDPEVTLPASAHVLLVAMKHTPGYPDLHFAPQEIAVIHNLCKSMALNPLEPGRRKQDVVSHLPQSKIFHFAGHGSNGADYDPLNSSLILEDGESDPLMVATLLEMNLRKHTPFLAYLSACGTGQNRDHRMVDENTHLISGFQVAGFRHVIGTLWKVNDELCADMARITYEGIKDGGMTDESVARGLHNAARELRRRWLCMPAKASLVQDKPETPSSSGRDQRDDGLLREFDVSDDEDGGEGERSLPWVPYVHFGV